MPPATYKSRFVTDGERLYEVDLHIRNGVILKDAKSGQLVSMDLRTFFKLEVVRCAA